MKEEAKNDTIRDLIERGKKRGTLTYAEIMDGLQGVELTPEQIDDIYEKLSGMGIEVIPETPDLEPL
ncbi:MAG: RNA polymerase sigma factor region1.1 domain-containing protein, partial [Desulfotomaculales bacterium]